MAGPLDGEAAAETARGRLEPAEVLYRRELAIIEQAFGPSNVHTAYVLNLLVDLYIEAGRYGEAEPLYRRSLAILEARFGANHARIGAFREKYAALLLKVGPEPAARREVPRSSTAGRPAEDRGSVVR